MARREGHRIASAASPRDLIVADDAMGGLLPYLDRVDVAAEPFVREDDWIRASHEVILDAYDEGLDLLELRFSPWFISSRTGLAPEAVIDAVTEGVNQARGIVGLRVGLIGILLRDLGPDQADPQLNTILSRRDAFCAIDIAGNEAGFAPGLFAPAYQRARDHGLRLTAHAGEAAGPQSVWEAVRLLGAERIGHGVRAVEDPALMDYLADHGITLELAFTSNVQTGAAASWASHPVRILHEHGVPVTLNTDNPRVSGVSVAHEHHAARVHTGLSEKQLDTIAMQALTSAFA
jgi:adenosine deaminase